MTGVDWSTANLRQRGRDRSISFVGRRPDLTCTLLGHCPGVGTYSTDVNYCFKNHKAVCRVMRSESPHVDPWPMTGHNTSAIRSDERYDAAAKAAAVG